MKPTWHVERGGKKVGPFTDQQLRSLASNGKLLATDILWREGRATPIEAGRVNGLWGSTPQMAPTLCQPTAPQTPAADRRRAVWPLVAIAACIAFSVPITFQLIPRATKQVVQQATGPSPTTQTGTPNSVASGHFAGGASTSADHIARFEAKVPKGVIERFMELKSGARRKWRVRDFKFDVRQTSSVVAPLEGEIGFIYQEALGGYDGGEQWWDTGSQRTASGDGVRIRAIYRLKGDRWVLQDLRGQAHDDPAFWWPMSERMPYAVPLVKSVLPDNF